MTHLTERASARKVIEPDLFDLDGARYPDIPGSKTEDGPSRIAAEKTKAPASKLRQVCLQEFRAAGIRGLTADELAKLLEESPFYVRPRVSELKAAGFIERAPARRQNDTGMSASVWVPTSKAFEEARP